MTMDVQPFISMAGQSNVFIFGNGMQINGQKNEARSGEVDMDFSSMARKVLVQDLTINAFSGDGLAVTGDAGDQAKMYASTESFATSMDAMAFRSSMPGARRC